MLKEIQVSADYLKKKLKTQPKIGIITGTGLGGVTKNMEVYSRTPYEEIPYFPKSTTSGHKGTLAFGDLAKRPVMVMEGRFHIYEGYTPEEITFPIRVMSNLGVKYLFISSAAGGLNPAFKVGDLMVVVDHINLTGKNPLIGPNLDAFGPRFPDMAQVYDIDLISLAKKNALTKAFFLQQGVYVGIIGPSLETPAETRFLRMIGADAVGMSTVLEVIVGVHCGFKIMVIVAITNLNLPDCMQQTSIDEVIAAATSASPILADLWENVIGDLPI